MEDRTSACLMFDGFHDKKIIVLLNLAFKWRLVNETSHLCRLTRRQINWPVQWNIALVQADTQAYQLTSAIDRAGYVTNFTESCASKSFFSQDSKGTCSLMFVSDIKNVYQENLSFVKPIHILYVFFKWIIGKTNCYWHMHFFFHVH